MRPVQTRNGRNLRQTENVTYVAPTRKRCSAFYSLKAPKNRVAQQKLNKGTVRRPIFDIPGQYSSKTRPLAKKLDLFPVKIAGEDRGSYTHEGKYDKVLWKHAVKKYKKRREVLPNETISAPTVENLSAMAEPVHRRAAEFESLLVTGKVDYKTGKNLLKSKRDNASITTRKRMEKRIQKFIAENALRCALKSEKDRIEILMYKTYSDEGAATLFANESLRPQLESMDEGVHFTYLNRNDISLSTFPKKYQDAQKKLKVYEKKFNCECTEGECNDSCLCFKMDKLINSDVVYDPASRRHHSCSEGCACKGKCSKSFPEPPKDGVEAVVHPIICKGGCLRSLQYHGTGESVVELRGKCRQPTKDDEANSYALTCYDPMVDDTVIRKMFKTNANRNGNEKIEPMNKKYERMIKTVTEKELIVDPRDLSSEGRYMASSCLGNLKVNLVYTKGLNPANIRVLMTSVVPIFPLQELTFFYSHEYVVKQLKDTCECGELCCIRHRELWPFITDDHVIEYYRQLYTHLFNEFEVNVLKSKQVQKFVPKRKI